MGQAKRKKKLHQPAYTDFIIIWEYDDDPDFSYLDQWNTPERYAGNEVIIDGQPLSFAEYMAGPGDPRNYVSLYCCVKGRCRSCGSLAVLASCGGFHFLETDSFGTGVFPESDLDLVHGYQHEESVNLLNEAKKEGGQ